MKVAGEAVSASSLAAEALASRLAAAAPLATLEDLLAATARIDPEGAVSWLIEQACARDDQAALENLLRQVLPVLVAGREGRALRRLLPLLARSAALLDAAQLGGAAELIATAEVPAEPADLEMLLAAAPLVAGVLRATAAARETTGDEAGTHELLTRLVFADPSAATLRSVQRWRARLIPDAGHVVRAALIGSSTLDLVAGYLDAECRMLGLTPELYTAPFNRWERESIDPASGLRSSGAEIAFLSVALDDVVAGIAGGADADAIAAAGLEAVERVATAAERIAGWFDGVLVVHGFHTAYGDPLGIAAGTGGLTRSLWVGQLNLQLAERLCRTPRTYFLDVQDVLLRRAAGPLDDPKMRHFAKLRFSAEGARQIAHAYAGYIAAVKGLTRKCVVVDLDNTLWGGVVGEDGINGIRLGTTSPGVEYLDFQLTLHSLAARGVLLAIASKNNEADALEVIRNHPSMLLRESAFSAMQINWGPKSESLRRIARDLNIGLDSLVFIDDNPNERALMRQVLPEVLTPELPRDPALYRSTIEALPQLQTLVVTAEDRARAGLYRAQRQREQVRVQATSLEAYLHSLAVEVSVTVDDARGTDRLYQLLQRTNQFNLTTRRHSAADLTRWMQDSAWHIYGLRARDRYGDHGLSAAALVRAEGAEWVIDSLLMSCRVISYGIETALLAALVHDAMTAGALTMRGEFIATTKNAPARDFYARHGFAAAETAGELQVFRLDLSGSAVACPAWIRMERL